MLLADRTLLLVDADGALLERLSSDLNRHGARCFPARDPATASWGARETLPDAIVCGFDRPGIDARALLAELRSAPESAALAGVALHARRPPSDGRSALAGPDAGFQKYLPEPVQTHELVDALCCVLGDRTLPLDSADAASELIEHHAYRQLLALLNAETEHRYSAFFRLEGDELQSVWTFDREQPESDPFTQRLALAATPCAPLFAHGASLPEPSADISGGLMRSFVGTPLVGLDALIFGALCHFSPEPRSHDPRALQRLEEVAKVLVHGERRRRQR